MTTSARIVCDSVNPNGQRLTTMVLVYPRFLLPEFNTHRMFTRCTASSRAIPVEKRIKSVMDDPVIPHWGMNKPGMQADVDADPDTADKALAIWLGARDEMVKRARILTDLGIHKQAVNRLLEPFVYVQTIVSATDWANFFALRCHPKAAPEMQKLAYAMAEAYRASEPFQVAWGGWHLPFIAATDYCTSRIDGCCGNLSTEAILVRASVARCARVSYNNHDGTKPILEKDIELYEKLVGSFPRHASATEHAAFACADVSFDRDDCALHDHGNFRGWHQHRKQISDENITTLPWEVEELDSSPPMGGLHSEY